MIIKCCVCGKVRVFGEWVHREISAAKAEISHTYCPKCAKTVKQKLSIQLSQMRFP